MTADNSDIKRPSKAFLIDSLVNISSQLETLEGQYWTCLDKEARWKFADACANAGDVIDNTVEYIKGETARSGNVHTIGIAKGKID